MTELGARREIIYAMDERKYERKPLRKYISGIDVETFATILVTALREKGVLKLDN